MTRIDVIQAIIDKIKGKTYLEIGSQNGDSFFKVRAKRKFAVDPKFKIPKKKMLGEILSRAAALETVRFYETTSDRFFLDNPSLFDRNKIDVAFVDGLHTYKQSLQDVFNCLRHLNDNGFIVLHDCNPAAEAIATPASSFQDAENKKVPGWAGYWSGDVWKTIVHLRSLHSELNVFVLDSDFGVGVVNKSKNEKPLSYSAKDIEQMSYSDLASKREELLNLKPESFLHEVLKKLS